jgi:hypothetical protein
MGAFVRDDLDSLLKDRPGPCVSIYMPAERSGGTTDLLRWKGNLGEAEERLIADGATVWARPDAAGALSHVTSFPASGDEELVNLAATSLLKRGRADYDLPPHEMPEPGAAMAALPFRPFS